MLSMPTFTSQPRWRLLVHSLSGRTPADTSECQNFLKLRHVILMGTSVPECVVLSTSAWSIAQQPLVYFPLSSNKKRNIQNSSRVLQYPLASFTAYTVTSPPCHVSCRLAGGDRRGAQTICAWYGGRCCGR